MTREVHEKVFQLNANSPLFYGWCVNKFERVGIGEWVLYRGRPGSCTRPWPCPSMEDPTTCPFSLCGKNE